MNYILVTCTILLFVIGIASISYAFSKCGMKAMLLGGGAVYAAATGMCDE